MIPETNILSFIPQRFPMVMVDRLLYADARGARTGFRVAAENIFVSAGVLREPGLVENMAQTAAVRAGFMARHENRKPAIGYIGDVKNLEISGFPKINEEIETEISVENQIFDITVISGKVWSGNKLLARCEMKIFITPSK